MALIGEGLSSGYPLELDTPQYTFGGASNYVNGTNEIPDTSSRVDSQFMNDVIDAIVAIESELGISPSGSFASVADRLAASTITTPGSPNTTDHAVLRWDGIDGDSVLNSVVIISDAGAMSGVASLDVGSVTFTGTINSITTTEFARLTGITSNIQVQIDAKAEGPGSSTDNAIARYHLATGKIIQNSGVIINDSEDISGLRDLSATRDIALARNLLIGGAVAGTSLDNGVVMASGTAPSGSHPSDAVQIWAQDRDSVGGTAGLYLRPETGTQLFFGDVVRFGQELEGAGPLPLTLAGLNIISQGSGASIILRRISNDASAITIAAHKVRGTAASPSYVALNDQCLLINGNAWSRNAADSADTFTIASSILLSIDSIDAQNRIGGNIRFFTSSGVSASLTEKARFSEAGNLGINQQSPAAKLHIQNNGVTLGGVVLGSDRVGVVSSDVLNGIEFWSNDTNLTNPGQLTAYMRSVATEAHTATNLGSRLSFATTANAATTPTEALRITQDGNIDVLVGQIQTNGARVNYNLAVYAAGTAYQLTATSALLNFGTTDPSIVLDRVGTYTLSGQVVLNYNAATFAANRTVTLKLRRTNNTAADVADSSIQVLTGIITTLTETFVVVKIPEVTYTTANTTDIIQIFGDVSVVPSAGSLDAVSASIYATRLY